MRIRDLFGVIVVAAIAVAGCHKDNPLFCEGHPADPSCMDAMPDTPLGCTSNAQCSGATAVCDLASKACVQCTAAEAQACTGMTPVCGGDDTCHGCTMHSQCASNVCLPDGSCSDGNNVAYVDPAGTDNMTCTKAMPCTKVAKALATTRPFVKFHGTSNEQVTINNQNVTLLADPGAQLTFSSAGVILKIDGTSTATIYDLQIANGLGATGIGISMPAGNTATLALRRAKVTGNGGDGISASGGTLTVSQSTISGNTGGGISASGGTLTVSQSTISGNTGGGISVTSAQFDLANNFIAKNGSATSTFGGVLLNQISSGTRAFGFNTITGNVGTTGTVTGVVCSLVTQAITFSNNVVYGNQVSGGGTQVGGTNCAYTYSDVGPDTVSGAGNINMDPLFVNATANNFHIVSGSPCKDAADPAATLATDIDGDSRPQGPRSDMGADEYKP